MWKCIFDCGKKHMCGCFASGRTAWWVREMSQEPHLHSVTHCLKWDVTKTVADADGREKNKMTQSSGPSTAAERVVWTLSNLIRPVRFWSVDGKNAEPPDKVVCTLCKLQLAYHSTTSNMRAHLENVHPNEHAMMSGTATEQPRLNSYFSPLATSSLS